MFAWVSVDRFRLFHWQYCPAPVSTDLCLCEWKCTLMNALVHCQLAECRPWRHCCSVTYTNMGMTRASFITISLSVLPSSPYFSPPSVLGHFYFVPFTLIIHVFFEYPFASFSLSVSFHTSLSHLYFVHLSPCFLWFPCLLFTMTSLPFVFCFVFYLIRRQIIIRLLLNNLFVSLLWILYSTAYP